MTPPASGSQVWALTRIRVSHMSVSGCFNSPAKHGMNNMPPASPDGNLEVRPHAAMTAPAGIAWCLTWLCFSHLWQSERQL